jgi:hypothetical protein
MGYVDHYVIIGGTNGYGDLSTFHDFSAYSLHVFLNPLF